MSTLTFIRDVARRPLEMGAILPSSPNLARAMIDAAAIAPGNVVLELGAGGGSFTEEIARRHPANPLVLVEPGQELATHLRQRFPNARVTTARAQDLPAEREQLGLQRIDRVVSGLPWALWSAEVQEEVLNAFVPQMAPGARFVTFHYVHSHALGRVDTLRGLLEARFDHVVRSSPVWSNVPPAFVHVAAGPRGR